jgi:hypothetical protein
MMRSWGSRTGMKRNGLRRELQEQLRKVGLELHPEKTRMIEFGKFAEGNRKRRKEKKPETFDFLAFHPHMWEDSDGRALHCQTEDDRQADARQAAGNPAEVAATNARCGSRDREVAAIGRAGLLQLSRGSRKRETAPGIPRWGGTVLAASITPSKPDKPHRLGAHGPIGSPVDSQRPHHASIPERPL